MICGAALIFVPCLCVMDVQNYKGKMSAPSPIALFLFSKSQYGKVFLDFSVFSYLSLGARIKRHFCRMKGLGDKTFIIFFFRSQLDCIQELFFTDQIFFCIVLNLKSADS